MSDLRRRPNTQAKIVQLDLRWVLSRLSGTAIRHVFRQYVLRKRIGILLKRINIAVFLKCVTTPLTISANDGCHDT